MPDKGLLSDPKKAAECARLPSVEAIDAGCLPECAKDKYGAYPNLICLLTADEKAAVARHMAMEHMEVFSSTSKTRKRFFMDFGDHGSYHPNLIPHPYKKET